MTVSSSAPERAGSYGERALAVEPGGAEFIPLSERHGTPIQLLWTWTSPNMEFATIFVGVLAVAGFGLSFWTAVLAILPERARVLSRMPCSLHGVRFSEYLRWCSADSALVTGATCFRPA
jgi:hypothetical protein